MREDVGGGEGVVASLVHGEFKEGKLELGQAVEPVSSLVGPGEVGEHGEDEEGGGGVGGLQESEESLVGKRLRRLFHQLPELHEVRVGTLEVGRGTHDPQDAFLAAVGEGDGLVVAFDRAVHLILV